MIVDTPLQKQTPVVTPGGFDDHVSFAMPEYTSNVSINSLTDVLITKLKKKTYNIWYFQVVTHTGEMNWI